MSVWKRGSMVVLGCALSQSAVSCSSDSPRSPDPTVTASGCPGITALEIKRDPLEYSENLVHGLSLVSLGEPASPVGSFEVAFMWYPSDVDLFEPAVFDGNAEDAASYFAARLQAMARRTSLNERFFWGDFKAGFDERFIVDVGHATKETGVVGYDAPAIRAAYASLEAQGLLAPGQEEYFLSLVVDDPTLAEWAKLAEAVRQSYTLRWTQDEVIAGAKPLVGDVIMTLVNAIPDTLVKVDLLGPITPNGGYTELTNVYYLQYEEGGVTEVLTSPLGDYPEALRAEIMALSDPAKRKSLKAAKRLFILARLLEDYPLMLNIAPLLQSDAAALSQIVGESEAVRAVLDKFGVGLSCENVALALGLQSEGFQSRVLNHSNAFTPEELDAEVFNAIYAAVTTDCEGGVGVLTTEAVDTWNEHLLKLETMLKPRYEFRADAYLAARGVDLNDPLENLSGQRGVCPAFTPISELVPYSCLEKQYGYCESESWKCMCSESWDDANYYDACMHVSDVFAASDPNTMSASDLIAQADAYCEGRTSYQTFDSCIWGARQVLSHCDVVLDEYVPTPTTPPPSN